MPLTILVSLSLLAVGTAATKQAGKESAHTVGGVRGNGAAPQTTKGNRLAFAGDQAGTSAAGHSATSTIESDPAVDYWRGLAQRRLHLLGKRERRIVALLVRIHKLRGSSGNGGAEARRDRTSPASIICRVFGSHCREAIAVATCESGLSIYARNPNPPPGDKGDYLGLFQFGDFARAHYGFAWNAWTQARAAYRYFLDAGWGPWECKP